MHLHDNARERERGRSASARLMASEALALFMGGLGVCE